MLQVPIPQEQRDELQEVRWGHNVAMKCMKVHGAKDRNTVTFLEGKHVENTGGLERHGNKTTRYKDIVQKTS